MVPPRTGLPDRIPRLDFELTAGCDHRCGHCYNVWGAEPADPQGGYPTGRPLSTEAMKALMHKAITQTGASHVTLTGGEPLLRRDALDLIAHIRPLLRSLTLITNGSHVPAATATRLAALRLSQVQLTLLAGERALHDRLKGAVCFDDTVRAAATLSRAGVRVCICFVAMRENAHAFEDVIELSAALGASHISYNRMSPTGGAVHQVARLMPTVEQLEANLASAQRLGPALRLKVGTAMPIPPCLVRTERYPWVDFGYCSTGSDSPNLVVDSRGQVRSCNLASGILGNFLDQDWEQIRTTTYPQTFVRDVPTMCKGCVYERSCQGGCKESAFAVFGDSSHPEPLLWTALDPAARDHLPVRQDSA
jgi:pyrroloquinoline quinone biosynthesis protein E